MFAELCKLLDNNKNMPRFFVYILVYLIIVSSNFFLTKIIGAEGPYALLNRSHPYTWNEMYSKLPLIITKTAFFTIPLILVIEWSNRKEREKYYSKDEEEIWDITKEIIGKNKYEETKNDKHENTDSLNLRNQEIKKKNFYQKVVFLYDKIVFFLTYRD